MRYKVGDKVLIKSLDWYNENRDKIGQVDCGGICFVPPMVSFCGQTVTISSILPTLEVYHIKEDGGTFNWTDEMIERLAERDGKTYPYKIGDRVVLKENNKCATITDLKYNSSGKLSYYISVDYPTDLLLPYNKLVEEGIQPLALGNSWECPQGYQFVDEKGNVINATKIALEKKKKEYPKTYEECCEILDVCSGETLQYGDLSISTDYEFNLYEFLENFRQLLICRDAYWKIAGEEMGLGRPWKPSDSDYITGRYCIFVNRGNIICDTPAQDCIFTFPAEEMRDAFYENFKNLIEICKELI